MAGGVRCLLSVCAQRTVTVRCTVYSTNLLTNSRVFRTLDEQKVNPSATLCVCAHAAVLFGRRSMQTVVFSRHPSRGLEHIAALAASRALPFEL